MVEKKLSVLGMGVVTDGYREIRELARAVSAEIPGAYELADGEELAAQDPLTQLAMGAAHQAWTMCKMVEVNSERVGLIFVSAWGAIDSTMAYLDSMLEAEGRYASPRHFSRSVYSAAASAMAIHFGIKGPCETLAFDEEAARGVGAVQGALMQAWRFIAAGRCERVMIVWADQAGELAVDLARRASETLHRQEYDRYVRDGVGQGAVAVVVGPAGGGLEVSLPPATALMRDLPLRGKPFPLDAAVSLLQSLLHVTGNALPN